MKITAGELYNAYQATALLSKNKLPVKGAYWLARLIRKLESEYQAIETQKNDLIRKHGKTKEDGSAQVEAAEIPAFMAEFSQVLSSELEVDCPMTDLEALGNGDIDGAALVPLQIFIKE